MVVGAVRAGLVVLTLLVAVSASPAATAAAVPGPARQPVPPVAPVTPVVPRLHGAGGLAQPAPPGGGDAGPSLLVATEGRQSTQASYPFVAGKGSTVSGRLRFLSQEYPEWFGSEYNDLFSVALATPQGAVVLATGNLNSSTWDAGMLGYGGAAETITFDEDLGRFAGQTVELQIHVANVADTFYDSAVAVFDLRIDDEPACSDADLTDRHGVPGSGDKRNQLNGHDSQFTGRDGARFRSLVETVAAEAGISPGLLAANALTEQPTRGAWLTTDPVKTPKAGVDDWGELAGRIRKSIPGSPAIATTEVEGVFENEQGRDIPILELANGRDALRAMAWTLRYAEVRMTSEVGDVYGALTANERFTLQRFAFNQGIPSAIDLLRGTDAGGEGLLITSGAIGKSHPQRTATVRAAQAVHLANTVFGEGATCR